jgi:hypothetical protein
MYYLEGGREREKRRDEGNANAHEPIEPVPIHILLVRRPRHVLVLEQIDERGDVRWDVVHIIVVHPEEVAPHRSDICQSPINAKNTKKKRTGREGTDSSARTGA